ncbi:MAG: thioredoxin fold domain-containing protein [Planctomycetota bacterium]
MLETIALLAAGAAPALPTSEEAHWYADYDKAVAVAEREGKDLFVEFTGSDWCHFCIQFHDEVLQHEEFWKNAQEDYVLVALDFPRGAEARAKVPNAKRNLELRDRHGIRGFPTVLLMTTEGEIYAKSGYRRGGAERYVGHLDTLRKKRPARTLELGSTVPASLALSDLDGKMHSFGDLRGKVVLVHFWSSTCPYDEHAGPVLAAMERRFEAPSGVVFLGIDSNQADLGRAPREGADHAKHYRALRKRVADAGVTHPVLPDHGHVVADLFQARTTPHCFVIDRKGVLRYSGALDDDPSGEKGDAATNYVEDALEAVLDGKTPKTGTAKPYGSTIQRADKDRS